MSSTTCMYIQVTQQCLITKTKVLLLLFRCLLRIGRTAFLQIKFILVTKSLWSHERGLRWFGHTDSYGLPIPGLSTFKLILCSKETDFQGQTCTLTLPFVMASTHRKLSPLAPCVITCYHRLGLLILIFHLQTQTQSVYFSHICIHFNHMVI